MVFLSSFHLHTNGGGGRGGKGRFNARCSMRGKGEWHADSKEEEEENIMASKEKRGGLQQATERSKYLRSRKNY